VKNENIKFKRQSQGNQNFPHGQADRQTDRHITMHQPNFAAVLRKSLKRPCDLLYYEYVTTRVMVNCKNIQPLQAQEHQTAHHDT